MSPALLPLFLDLRDQEVLLVGGGSVALAKLRALRPTGCRLRVVARAFSPAFQAEAAAWGLLPQERAVRSSDLDGVRLLVSASNAPGLNAELAALARSRGIWVNAVDDPESCDVQFAATLRRGPWTLALSTGGAFPGLSRSLRRLLDDLLPAGDLELLEDLTRVRARLRQRLPDPAARGAALRDLLETLERTYFGLEEGTTP